MGKMFGGQVFAIFGIAILLISGFLLFGYEPQASPDIPAAGLAIAMSIAAMAALGFVLDGICFFAKRKKRSFKYYGQSSLSSVVWPFPFRSFPPGDKRSPTSFH